MQFTRLPVVLDIETVPLGAALQAAYPEGERPAPGNYKDPEKIAAWRVADEAKWREQRVKECSLNPRLGRALCIGYALPCSDAPSYATEMAQSEDDEARLLRGFWKIAGGHEGRVVTWNGTWDLQFLVTRSIHHGITPTLPSDTIRAWFRKYSVHPHCDVKALLTNWNPTDGHLDEWAKFLGVEGKTDGMDGSKVYELYQAGEFSKIAEYCKQDVACTYELYRKVSGYFCEVAA